MNQNMTLARTSVAPPYKPKTKGTAHNLRTLWRHMDRHNNSRHLLLSWRVSTYLVLVVWLAVVGSAHSEDDDHDQQSSTGGQDSNQGFVICWRLQAGKKDNYFQSQ